MSDETDKPLSETEAALFAAMAALVQATARGPERKLLGVLLDEQRAGFLQSQQPQAAALLGLLASYASEGHS